MLKGFYILMAIFLLGFLLVPGQSYACKSHAPEHIVKEKKSCCNHTGKMQKDECKKNCCHKAEEASNKPCSGKCGGGSCQSAPRSFSATLASANLSGGQFATESQKQYFPYKQPYYSTGYTSIWQPPKIS